jgi:phosphoglycerate dehydrogenase-like enzyme
MKNDGAQLGARVAHEGPLRVLVGKERFSENHAWSEMPQHWPAGLAGRAVIEVVGQGQLEARLADGGPPVDVVVPLWSPVPGRAIRAGSFGLIQQFGVGVDNIDLDAAADEGVWVANMPGLNAVPVAEHAVALLLALARRFPEASKGFEPGRWGEPAGRSLAGTAACIVGAGAIGTQIARVRFRHPLVRSAAYRSASAQTRQELHSALADVTDPAVDPDRRAWHRAQAAPGLDEQVAAELEQCASQAQGRRA